MSQLPIFQAVIESVEALSNEEQDLLFQLVQKRRIAKRRQEIAQNATQTLAAVDSGTAKRGSVSDLMLDALIRSHLQNDLLKTICHSRLQS